MRSFAAMHDKYLDPPSLPAHGVCERCGDVFGMEELNDDYLCEECAKYYEQPDEEE